MKRHIGKLFYGLLALVPLAPLSAQGPDDSEPVKCIRLAAIDRTEIIDDRRIAFHMRNREIYVNNLDHACPDLRRDRAFGYQTSTGRLCSVDVITILDRFASGLSRGATCRLGMFSPVTEDMLAMMKGEEEEGDVTVVPIEVDPADTDAAGASEE